MNRKTYIFLCISVFVLISAILLSFISVDKAVKTSNNIADFKPTIIIDAGHGGEDGGASTENNILEKDINLKISLKLKDIFETNGFSVILTRENDTDLSTSDKNKKREDLKNRVSLFNNSVDNVVISIHQNKFTDPKYRGAQIFYSDNHENNKNLAECIRKSIIQTLQPYNERQNKKAGSEIFILDNTNVPAILIECGFLSNYEDISLLTNNEYQNKLAFSIYVGFLEYYYTNY